MNNKYEVKVNNTCHTDMLLIQSYHAPHMFDLFVIVAKKESLTRKNLTLTNKHENETNVRGNLTGI